MTEGEGEGVNLTGILVAIALVVPAILILVAVSWLVYSPNIYEEQYDNMSKVNTTGLVWENFTYELLSGEGTGPSVYSMTWSSYATILKVSDPITRKYYQVRVLEAPDYGAALPIGPKEVVNSTRYGEPVILTHVLNGCTITKLIITTDTSYFIKDLPQTMMCG